MKNRKLMSVFLCSVLTFGIDFIVIPRLRGGWPDAIWMAGMILLPLEVAWLFYEKISRPAPAWLFATMAVQYMLLILLAKPISVLFGSSIEHTLGWFGYIGAAFPWPIVVTLMQFIVIICIRKVKIRQ